MCTATKSLPAILPSIDCLIGSSRSFQPSFIRPALTSSKSTVMPWIPSTVASASPCQNSSRFHIVMKALMSASLCDGVVSRSRV